MLHEKSVRRRSEITARGNASGRRFEKYGRGKQHREGSKTVDVVDPWSSSVHHSRRRDVGIVREAHCESDREAMRRVDRTSASASSRRYRRDSDIILSNFGHKEHLFKFLVIGDYGVGESRAVNLRRLQMTLA